MTTSPQATSRVAPGATADAARARAVRRPHRLERDIWALGGRVYGPAELQALRDRVDQWTAAREGTSFPGVVRVADLPGAAAGARAKGLFAPIEDATRQIEVAKNGLLPGLDVSLDYNSVSDPGDTTPAINWDRRRWSSSVDVDLPLDRKAERNIYRASLIDLERAKRNKELAYDRARLETVSYTHLTLPTNREV